MSWLKNSGPAPRPAPPKSMDLNVLYANLTIAELEGAEKTPIMTYLEAHLPERSVDRWGQKLPLSAVDQERLDRMCGVLFDPSRVRKLLLSGRLDTGEVDALSEGNPALYSEIVAQAKADMARTRPPYSRWAEAVLGVLFGRDASLVYGEDEKKQPAPGSKITSETAPPLPADLTAEPALKR